MVRDAKWVVAVMLGLGMVAALGGGKEGEAGKFEAAFKKDENPLAQEGKWINGKKEGIDWADVCVKGGLAFGTEGGKIKYDDSTALVAGKWGADQMAEAKVHTVNQKGGDIYEEVELRLRSSIKAHVCTGYEVNFRCVGHEHGYNQIVRWNGKLGDFKILADGQGGGVADGDVVRATIVGNVITVYKNGKKVNEAKDDTFKEGNPGMGFYLEGGDATLNGDFGFTRFSAE